MRSAVVGPAQSCEEPSSAHVISASFLAPINLRTGPENTCSRVRFSDDQQKMQRVSGLVTIVRRAYLPIATGRGILRG